MALVSVRRAAKLAARVTLWAALVQGLVGRAQPLVALVKRLAGLVPVMGECLAS